MGTLDIARTKKRAGLYKLWGTSFRGPLHTEMGENTKIDGTLLNAENCKMERSPPMEQSEAAWRAVRGVLPGLTKRKAVTKYRRSSLHLL